MNRRPRTITALLATLFAHGCAASSPPPSSTHARAPTRRLAALPARSSTSSDAGAIHAADATVTDAGPPAPPRAVFTVRPERAYYYLREGSDGAGRTYTLAPGDRVPLARVRCDATGCRPATGNPTPTLVPYLNQLSACLTPQPAALQPGELASLAQALRACRVHDHGEDVDYAEVTCRRAALAWHNTHRGLGARFMALEVQLEYNDDGCAQWSGFTHCTNRAPCPWQRPTCLRVIHRLGRDWTGFVLTPQGSTDEGLLPQTFFDFTLLDASSSELTTLRQHVVDRVNGPWLLDLAALAAHADHAPLAEQWSLRVLLAVAQLQSGHGDLAAALIASARNTLTALEGAGLAARDADRLRATLTTLTYYVGRTQMATPACARP